MSVYITIVRSFMTALFVCMYVCEYLGSVCKKCGIPRESLMKCLPKLRVPCGQHSARAQTQSNLSISGLVAQRPTPTQDVERKHS